MKIVSYLSIFVLTAMASSVFAAPSEVSQYLTYPNTTLVVLSKEDGVRQKIPIVKNFDQPKKKNSPPRFYSTIPTDITDHASFDYEMFKKTDYGDLYLFVIHRKGQKDAAYPVLFAGSPQTIVDAADFKMELLPNPPVKK